MYVNSYFITYQMKPPNIIFIDCTIFTTVSVEVRIDAQRQGLPLFHEWPVSPCLEVAFENSLTAI